MVKRGMTEGNFPSKPYKKQKLEEISQLKGESFEDFFTR